MARGLDEEFASPLVCWRSVFGVASIPGGLLFMANFPPFRRPSCADHLSLKRCTISNREYRDCTCSVSFGIVSFLQQIHTRTKNLRNLPNHTLSLDSLYISAVQTYFWRYCGATRTITFSPCIKPYHTSRPPALLNILPCISLIPLFLVIGIVRSTKLSRSQIVRVFRPFL